LPEHVNSLANVRRGWRHDGATEKLRDHCIAQSAGAAFVQSSAHDEGDLPRLDLGVSTFVIVVETLGELLKFVVKSRLPIERLKQSITSLSRAVGMRLARAEFSVDLGLEEEDSQGFGITPT
jgi:hypothetical protein